MNDESFFLYIKFNITFSNAIQVRRAMLAGVPPENISLSTQELPADFAEFVKMGVKINAW